MTSRAAVFAITTALALSLFADAATAACTRLGFSVNDYGKDGPTKDAKDLLDKYVAKWAAERGIKKYTIGKKEVKCELFLDVILFDEHTCRAEAPVCFEGKVPADVVAAAKAAPGAKPKATAKAVKTSAPVATGSIPAARPKAPAAPAVTPAAAAPAPAAVPTPAAATPAPAAAPAAVVPPVEAPKPQ